MPIVSIASLLFLVATRGQNGAELDPEWPSRFTVTRGQTGANHVGWKAKDRAFEYDVQLKRFGYFDSNDGYQSHIAGGLAPVAGGTKIDGVTAMILAVDGQRYALKADWNWPAIYRMSADGAHWLKCDDSVVLHSGNYRVGHVFPMPTWRLRNGESLEPSAFKGHWTVLTFFSPNQAPGFVARTAFGAQMMSDRYASKGVKVLGVYVNDQSGGAELHGKPLTRAEQEAALMESLVPEAKRLGRSSKLTVPIAFLTYDEYHKLHFRGTPGLLILDPEMKVRAIYDGWPYFVDIDQPGFYLPIVETVLNEELAPKAAGS